MKILLIAFMLLSVGGCIPENDTKPNYRDVEILDIKKSGNTFSIRYRDVKSGTTLTATPSLLDCSGMYKIKEGGRYIMDTTKDSCGMVRTMYHKSKRETD